MTFSRRDGAVYIKGFLAATTGDSEVPKRYSLALSLFWNQGFEDGSVFVNKIVPLMLSGKQEVSDPMHPMIMGLLTVAK